MRGRRRAGLRSETRHTIGVLALVHVAFGLILGLQHLGLLPMLERLVYDRYLSALSAPQGADADIVIVEYTEADEALYGYPLPDRDLAALLERLTDAGPVAIGLDLIRDRPEPQGGDPAGYERLLAALGASDSVIGIVKETGAGFGPPPALAEEPTRLGFADVIKDPDGVVRRGLLYLTTPGGTTRPSFALQLAARRLVAEGVAPAWNDDRLALGAADYAHLRPEASGLYAGTSRPGDDGGYQFLLTFPGCPDAWRRVSINEVLDGSAGSLDLDARLVLIGNTVQVAKDRFEVPVDCAGPLRGEMFGVHLHAAIASQLIGQANGATRPIETPAQRFASAALGRGAELGWTWLCCLLGGMVAILVGSPLWLAVAGTGGVAVIVGASLGAFFGAGLWLPVAAPLLGVTGAATLSIAYLMTRARTEREQLMGLFGAAVSERVAGAIWRTRSALGKPPPELMMATMLFSDIRGFSTISTMLPESRLAMWLDLYMEAMVEIVERHGGVIEKFAGDGLTVGFGIPEPRATDAEVAADARAAVDCALAMATRLEELNRAMAKRDLPEITIRVGIHSGPLMAGIIGGAKRWQFSIVGDTANTAARLESYDKDDPRLGCDTDHARILISEATWHLLDGRYAAEPVGSLEMRNRGPIGVYRITGVRRDLRQDGGSSR